MNIPRLYEAWLVLGLDPERFWLITPGLYLIETSAARRRLEQQQEMDITVAWLSAKLARAKKIPPLKKLLGKGGKADIGFYLDVAKSSLPKVRLSELLARGPRTDTPE